MTHFIIDTNVLLWYFWDNKRIKSIKNLINSDKIQIQIHVSVASFWEILTKIRSGKLKVDINEIYQFAEKYAFHELPITGNILKAYSELLKIHHDPFDHMLLAQAITCPMRLITCDAILAEYSSLVMVI